MKRTIEITRKTKKEVEIIFPLYTKTSCHYYYFKNEKELIGVSLFSLGDSISVYSDTFSYTEWANEKKSNRNQFIKAYNTALKSINKIIEP
jgi:hypothetical protein